MPIPLRTPLLVGCAVVACSLSARASAQTVLVSNLAEPKRDTSAISQLQWAAQSFLTDGSSSVLWSVQTRLGDLLGAPVVAAELRADDGTGLPGALLTTFTHGAIPAGPPATLTLTPGAVVPLAPGTLYWLVLGVSGPGQFGWDYAQGDASAGPGSLEWFAYSLDQGATWGGASDLFPVQVRVDVVTTAAPEPGTLSLLALGAALTLAAARRARRGP